MNNITTRFISITNETRTYQVPFTCAIENRKEPFQVRFELEKTINPTDLEFVTVYYDGAQIKIITNRNNKISEGYLYDQFSKWYRELYSITVDAL